jgi:hypothetical protein
MARIKYFLKGSTLLETLISTVILVVLIVILFTFLNQTIKETTDNNMDIVASVIDSIRHKNEIDPSNFPIQISNNIQINNIQETSEEGSLTLNLLSIEKGKEHTVFIVTKKPLDK